MPKADGTRRFRHGMPNAVNVFQHILHGYHIAQRMFGTDAFAVAEMVMQEDIIAVVAEKAGKGQVAFLMLLHTMQNLYEPVTFCRTVVGTKHGRQW